MSNQIHTPAVLFPGKAFSVTTEWADPNAILQTQVIAIAGTQTLVVKPAARCSTVQIANKQSSKR